MQTEPQQKSELKKSCVNCGAELVYAPGTTELQCEYCHYTQEINPSENTFEEKSSIISIIIWQIKNWKFLYKTNLNSSLNI